MTQESECVSNVWFDHVVNEYNILMGGNKWTVLTCVEQAVYEVKFIKIKISCFSLTPTQNILGGLRNNFLYLNFVLALDSNFFHAPCNGDHGHPIQSVLKNIMRNMNEKRIILADLGIIQQYGSTVP